MKIFTFLRLLLTSLLAIIFYISFELQNGWPFNEDRFIYMQIISVISVLAAMLLAAVKLTQVYSAIPLLISYIVISILSRSSLSLAGIITNLAIIVSVFLISYFLRREGAGRPNSAY